MADSIRDSIRTREKNDSQVPREIAKLSCVLHFSMSTDESPTAEGVPLIARSDGGDVCRPRPVLLIDKKAVLSQR